MNSANPYGMANQQQQQQQPAPLQTQLDNPASYLESMRTPTQPRAPATPAGQILPQSTQVTPNSNQSQRNASQSPDYVSARSQSQGLRAVSRPPTTPSVQDTPRKQADAPTPRLSNASSVTSPVPRQPLTRPTNTGFAVVISLPPLRPSGMDLNGTQQFPLVTAGVRWTVNLMPLGRREFNSLNAALACLDEQIRNRPQLVTSDAIMRAFDDLRQQYAQRVKMQKEYGGSLLFEFAELSKVRQQYHRDQAVFDNTKDFWAEAKRDRTKVTRHIEGLRRLVEHGWTCREFMEGYVMKSMGTEVVETNVYEQHFSRARQWGLSLRQVMQRAEQRRMMRIQEVPETSNLDITVRDINLAVNDLVEDENATNEPDERVTNAQLKRFTDKLRRVAPDRVPAEGLWGYVDERRQMLIPPSPGMPEIIKKVRERHELQERYEAAHPTTAVPPRTVKIRRAKNVGKEGFAKDGVLLPKRKGANKKGSKRKRDAAAKSTMDPAKPAIVEKDVTTREDEDDDNDHHGGGDDDNDSRRSHISENVGSYTGGHGEQGPISVRAKLTDEEIMENELSKVMGSLSLKVARPRRILERPEKVYVQPNELALPENCKRTPFKTALFNRAVSDALLYCGLDGRRPMSKEDIQAFSNSFGHLPTMAHQAGELFDELSESRMANETVLILIGQIHSMLGSMYESFRRDSYATEVITYFTELWRRTFGPSNYIPLQAGARPGPGHASLTLYDFRSLNVQDTSSGWLTDQAILAALLTSTENIYLPDMMVLHSWAQGLDDEPPIRDEARMHRRIALVFNLENHWLTVTIDTQTRTWNILDSAEYMDIGGTRRRQVVDLLEQYLRAQFPAWFTAGAQPPRGGSRTSEQQSNHNDCGIYVIENLLAFDQGEEQAQEVFPQAVRFRLAERFASRAMDVNQQTPTVPPPNRPRPSLNQMDAFTRAVKLRPAEARYDILPDNIARFSSSVTKPLVDLYDAKTQIFRRTRERSVDLSQPEGEDVRKDSGGNTPRERSRGESSSVGSSHHRRQSRLLFGPSPARTIPSTPVMSPSPTQNTSQLGSPSGQNQAMNTSAPVPSLPAQDTDGIQHLIDAATVAREQQKKAKEDAEKLKKSVQDTFATMNLKK